MDLDVVITVMGSLITMVGVMMVLVYWMRSEANALRTEAKEDRKDLIQISRNIENEMKDFHSRLLEIERNRGK